MTELKSISAYLAQLELFGCVSVPAEQAEEVAEAVVSNPKIRLEGRQRRSIIKTKMKGLTEFEIGYSLYEYYVFYDINRYKLGPHGEVVKV